MSKEVLKMNAMRTLWTKMHYFRFGQSIRRVVREVRYFATYGFHINCIHALRKSEKNLRREGGGARQRWRSKGCPCSKVFSHSLTFKSCTNPSPVFFREQWTNVKVRSVDERQPLARESLHSGPQHTCHSSEWLSGLKGKQQDLHFELIIINMLIWRRLRTSSCDTVASEGWSR